MGAWQGTYCGESKLASSLRLKTHCEGIRRMRNWFDDLNMYDGAGESAQRIRASLMAGFYIRASVGAVDFALFDGPNPAFPIYQDLAVAKRHRSAWIEHVMCLLPGEEKHLETGMPILSISDVGLEALLEAVDRNSMQSHGTIADVAYLMGPNPTPGGPSGDSVLLLPRAEVIRALQGG